MWSGIKVFYRNKLDHFCEVFIMNAISPKIDNAVVVKIAQRNARSFVYKYEH